MFPGCDGYFAAVRVNLQVVIVRFRAEIADVLIRTGNAKRLANVILHFLDRLLIDLAEIIIPVLAILFLAFANEKASVIPNDQSRSKPRSSDQTESLVNQRKCHAVFVKILVGFLRWDVGLGFLFHIFGKRQRSSDRKNGEK